MLSQEYFYTVEPMELLKQLTDEKLESLGYKISVGSQYNESYFTISW